jgi:ankyrin repeat protein
MSHVESHEEYLQRKQEEEELSDLAIAALAAALMGNSGEEKVISAEDAQRAQAVARTFQDMGNPDFQERINDKLGPRGVTRLMYVSQKGGEAFRVRQLIRNGALRSLMSKEGKTALYYAVEAGQLENIDVLLNEPIPFPYRFRKDSVKIHNDEFTYNNKDDDNSPFLRAIQDLFYWWSAEEEEHLETVVKILKLLIAASKPEEFYSKPYIKYLFNEGDLALGLYHEDEDNLVDKILEIAELIWQKAENNSFEDIELDLRECIEKGRIRFSKFLTEKLILQGKNINSLDYKISSLEPVHRLVLCPLMLLSGRNTLEMARMLLDLGADVNAVTERNENILLYILKKENSFFFEVTLILNLARLLLNVSSDSINAVTTDGHQRHILGEAFRHIRSREFIDLLLENGADPILGFHSNLL